MSHPTARPVPSQRPGFRIVLATTAGDCYEVSPVPASADVAVFACKFDKRSGPVASQYHVHQSAELGHWSCECPDFLARGHKRPCKHIRLALALRRVFGGQELAHA